MQSLNSVRREIGCRETDVVVQCARTFVSGAEVGCLQAALKQPLDWVAVERFADYHAIMPPVAFVLKLYGGELVPPELRERFRQRLRFTVQSNLAWLLEWRRLLRVFEASSISVISIKGPALTLLAYRNLALREFVDLDLLIRPGDVSRARDMLIGEGYRLSSPLAGDTDAALLRSRNRQLGFINEGGGTLVEMHWGAVHAMFSFQLPVNQLFESAHVEFRDGMSFLSLAPEYLLLYICAHGTKHCWSSLRWLCDVACYIQTVQTLDWGLCIRRAETTNCNLVLKHSLLMAQQVLGLELPSPIRDYVCGDAKALALAKTASAFLFRDDGELGYRETLRYHLAFARDWRDRIHLVRERVFAPAEPDWQKVRLPRSLYFLYYLVRPVRFLMERLSNTDA